MKHGGDGQPVMVDPWRLLLAAGHHELIPDKEGHAALDPDAGMRPPIGKILLQAHMLKPAQVMRVLAAQADEPDMRFGEIAVQLGLCTRHEIEWALLEQLASADHPMDLLAQKADADPEEVIEILLTYVHQLEARLRDVRDVSLAWRRDTTGGGTEVEPEGPAGGADVNFRVAR